MANLDRNPERNLYEELRRSDSGPSSMAWIVGIVVLLLIAGGLWYGLAGSRMTAPKLGDRLTSGPPVADPDATPGTPRPVTTQSPKP